MRLVARKHPEIEPLQLEVFFSLLPPGRDYHVARQFSVNATRSYPVAIASRQVWGNPRKPYQ
jgi:hypothetical protein